MEDREEPKLPTWLPRVAGEDGAHAIWNLLNKQIFSSDVCNQQNRFRISKRVISQRLLPAMFEAEKQATSFLNYPESGRRRRRWDRPAGNERRPRLVGHNHGQLEVMVYDQRGWVGLCSCRGGTAAARRCSKDPITELYPANVSWRFYC